MKTIFHFIFCTRIKREVDRYEFCGVTFSELSPYFPGNEFARARWFLTANRVDFYTTNEDYWANNPACSCPFLFDYRGEEVTAHPLSAVFDDVLKQVMDGKGKERHGKTEDGRDLTFLDQPLMVITRYVGNGYPLGQAMKKLSEVPAILSQKGKDAAYQEILGAIAYAASAALYLQEKSIHD